MTSPITSPRDAAASAMPSAGHAAPQPPTDLLLGDTWHSHIEAQVRGGVRELIEGLLQAELAEALGRQRYRRLTSAPQATLEPVNGAVGPGNEGRSPSRRACARCQGPPQRHATAPDHGHVRCAWRRSATRPARDGRCALHRRSSRGLPQGHACCESRALTPCGQAYDDTRAHAVEPAPRPIHGRGQRSARAAYGSRPAILSVLEPPLPSLLDIAKACRRAQRRRHSRGRGSSGYARGARGPASICLEARRGNGNGAGDLEAD
jgi:hypothetical protein